MSIEVHINTKLVEKWLNTKSKLFYMNAKNRISRASWQFITWLTLAQLSGRKSENYGLNVVTGTLRRSFKARTIGNGSAGDIVTKIYTTVKYAMYWQKPKERVQKLYAFESYAVQGLKFYRAEIAEAIKETANA